MPIAAVAGKSLVVARSSTRARIRAVHSVEVYPTHNLKMYARAINWYATMWWRGCSATVAEVHFRRCARAKPRGPTRRKARSRSLTSSNSVAVRRSPWQNCTPRHKLHNGGRYRLPFLFPHRNVPAIAAGHVLRAYTHAERKLLNDGNGQCSYSRGVRIPVVGELLLRVVSLRVRSVAPCYVIALLARRAKDSPPAPAVVGSGVHETRQLHDRR